MTDDDLARWLARLPLAERLNLERRDEEATRAQRSSTGYTGPRCPVCNGHVAGPVVDYLGRCKTCAKARRGTKRLQSA